MGRKRRKRRESEESDIAWTGRVLREQRKKESEENLMEADPEGWKQHTLYHWSRFIDGYRLDYWPSRKKFRYRGRTRTGDVKEFMREILAEEE